MEADGRRRGFFGAREGGGNKGGKGGGEGEKKNLSAHGLARGSGSEAEA
jgi:hypothetical protein